MNKSKSDVYILSIGEGAKSATTVTQDEIPFILVPGANILLQDDEDTLEHFHLWLDNNTISQAAEALNVSRNVILAARKFFKCLKNG